MKVILAQSAGFCWGVERAIKKAVDFAEGGHYPVYTDGPLIHNKQMINRLENMGVREIGDYVNEGEFKADKDQSEKSILLVRAHGISPDRRAYLKNLGIKFSDATCPDVNFIAGKIRTYAKKGYTTIIFGDAKHPEVIGLLGYTEGKGYAVESRADVDKLPKIEDAIVFVSQSTMFTDEFDELAIYLKEIYPEVIVFDTICKATKERQNDLVRLVQMGVDAIVVIGGLHSANTVKLAKLARKQNLPTYHIETADEIDEASMAQYATVGVTAGASTPKFIIDAVCKRLEAIQPEMK